METLVALYANNPNVPHNSEQPEIISLNIAFIAVTIAIVTLRIVVRTFIVKHVALEDYLMIAAGVFGVAFSSLNIAGPYVFFPSDTLGFNILQAHTLASAAMYTTSTSPI